MITTAVRPAIEKEIRKIVAEHLKDYDVESVSVEPREDVSGDEAIFVDIRYRLSGREFYSSIGTSLRDVLNERLVAKGELRVPYVNHFFHPKQQVKR